ncbi:hypothetical protein [Capnocytophaga sp.]|uniref:DUF6994 family protein n=1 Tax=Capnocytophaga sp. TaxID=44737 RepID=UPI0026DC2BB8|nr:hypothetical protein [Capnocytophaga sp.]MDO5104664.1 hypothetical protein [Capnocytophaga sp.]
MQEFNVNFDFRIDSKCGDPDTDSRKLYEIHKILWSKKLPNEDLLIIDIQGNNRLLLRNNLCMNLSSDRMCPHFSEKYNNKFDPWLSELEREQLMYKVRTMGGHIIFPAHKHKGLTINQARGIHPQIGDRFDLTLECIRRFYINESNPLSAILSNYKFFFDLFVDFEGYINFFLLQDFINSQGQVHFSLPFDDFKSPPFPLNASEYKSYKSHIINLIDKRNKRISEYMKFAIKKITTT